MTFDQFKKVASLVATAACLLLAAAVLLPALLGVERYAITSGSMAGSYDRGSILYARDVPTESLRVGDVITYSPPGAAGASGLITHRIASIRRDADGSPVFRTKGDANPVADPWQFTLERPTQAKAVFSVPYVGYALAALGVRHVRMLLIGLPALLVAVGILVGLWRKAGEEVRRREEALQGTGA